MCGEDGPPRRDDRHGGQRGLESAERSPSTSTSGGWWVSIWPKVTCTAAEGKRIQWSFHPEREKHLVEEVVSYWQRHGVNVRVHRSKTARVVDRRPRVWSRPGGRRISASAATSYTQRVPNLAWEQTIERKRALLSGLWEGDGSWSLVNGGPSVILEWGTVSDELAEGVARLLGDVGHRLLVAPRPHRQVDEGDALAAGQRRRSDRARDVPRPGARPRRGLRRRSAGRRSGSGRRASGASTAARRGSRVVDIRRERYAGLVYSLEVTGSHTVVATNGLVVHQLLSQGCDARSSSSPATRATTSSSSTP